jgi:hypothetical protein
LEIGDKVHVFAVAEPGYVFIEDEPFVEDHFRRVWRKVELSPSLQFDGYYIGYTYKQEGDLIKRWCNEVYEPGYLAKIKPVKLYRILKNQRAKEVYAYPEDVTEKEQSIDKT